MWAVCQRSPLYQGCSPPLRALTRRLHNIGLHCRGVVEPVPQKPVIPLPWVVVGNGTLAHQGVQYRDLKVSARAFRAADAPEEITSARVENGVLALPTWRDIFSRLGIRPGLGTGCYLFLRQRSGVNLHGEDPWGRTPAPAGRPVTRRKALSMISGKCSALSTPPVSRRAGKFVLAGIGVVHLLGGGGRSSNWVRPGDHHHGHALGGLRHASGGVGKAGAEVGH